MHFLFIFQRILFANLNVNADHCILLFLDRGHFEVWRESISKQYTSNKINLKDWNLFFVFHGSFTIRLASLFGGFGKTKLLVYQFFAFLLYFFTSDFYYPEAFCRNFLYLPAWKGSLDEQGLSKFLINEVSLKIWVTW